MGCTPSTAPKEQENVSTFDFSRRNTLVRRPEVLIDVGPGVKKVDQERRVVVMFGGPGSTKGSIINDLVKMFGFVFISAEDLILKNLPEKLANKDPESGPITGTHDLAKATDNNPDVLTLAWVLSLLVDEINHYKGRFVLVDLIPNMKFLLKADSFIKNCDNEMEEFENRVPCAFALNMTLSRENLIKNIKSSHACIKSHQNFKQIPSESSVVEKGDEMDTARTQRRFSLYENSVKEFVNYFRKDHRVVKVDTSSSQWHLIWEALMDFFAGEMDFDADRGINSVVLFAFDSESARSVDTDRYPMKRLQLSELVDDPYAPTVKLLSVLARHLDESALQTRSFLVDLSGTSIDENSVSEFDKPTIMFVDVNVGQLDYFIHGLTRKTFRKKSVFRKKAQYFKAICTTENETLLFPEHIDTELCRRIAICLSEQREAVPS